MTNSVGYDYFDYCKIDEFDKNNINLFKQSRVRFFDKEMLSWDAKKHSTWMLRLYASIKMLLSSTVMFTSYEFSLEKNIYLSLPYFEYYALLHSCRAFLFVCHDELDFDKLFNMTHSKIINVTANYLKSINVEYSENFAFHLKELKQKREKYSYQLPTSSVITSDSEESYRDSLDYARLLGELSQLSSAVMSNSYKTNSSSKLFKFDLNDVSDFIKKYFDSSEDWCRLIYMTRKMNYPSDILCLSTEGLTEDFIGNFLEEYLNDNELSPLHNLQLIYPFP